MTDELRTTELVNGSLTVRDFGKRELEMLIVPFDTVIDTTLGPEEFKRGAFKDVNPNQVRLRMDHQDPPTGKGFELWEDEDGAHMVFRVAKTARGDEQLTLVSEGVSDGASVGFRELPGGTTTETRNGRRVRAHRKVELREVSTTWQPAYEQAAVVAIRSTQENDMADLKTVREEPEPPTEPDKEPAPEARSDAAALARIDDGFTRIADTFGERLANLEERARSVFAVPAAGEDQHTDVPAMGKWMEIAVRMLTGERVPDTQYRLVAEVVTSDNIGVVPPAYLSELIGVIDQSRPFLASTRRLNTPAAGMSMVVPKITQRPTTAVQAAEKDELSSTATNITTETFNVTTIGGVGDISLQLLKRSDPSFLELFLQLLGEAYAIDAEDRALRALFNEIGGGVGGASSLDPNNLSLGTAYQTSFSATRRPPDTIWLSTEAVGEFIDAKATTSNMPLYSNITANATAGGGISGNIQGLRAVHVPSLDSHGCFALVGPSSGFAWAEDGTYTLQVDVPSKAGRDVALVGMLWFAPWYPDAFTAFNVAS